jgi:hypothetical protein
MLFTLHSRADKLAHRHLEELLTALVKMARQLRREVREMPSRALSANYQHAFAALLELCRVSGALLL